MHLQRCAKISHGYEADFGCAMGFSSIRVALVEGLATFTGNVLMTSLETGIGCALDVPGCAVFVTAEASEAASLFAHGARDDVVTAP